MAEPHWRPPENSCSGRGGPASIVNPRRRMGRSAAELQHQAISIPVLDPRDQLTPAALQQLAPGASLPPSATVRMAEVTAGV